MKHLKSINEEIENKEFVLIDTDDWSGLYYNGKLVDEGHSIDWKYVIKKIFNCSIDSNYIDQEDFEEYFGSHCPETLDEVKIKLDAKKYNL